MNQNTKLFCYDIAEYQIKIKLDLFLRTQMHKELAVMACFSIFFCFNTTGKSLSEALILASTNPQYDKRLFIKLRVQYMKITSSEHLVYIKCSECRNKNKKTIYVVGAIL